MIWPANYRSKQMRTLLLLSVALGLTGCAGSMPLIKSADPCADPVQVPERWLSDREVEVLWSRDRQELLDCGDKVDVLSGRKPE